MTTVTTIRRLSDNAETTTQLLGNRNSRYISRTFNIVPGYWN